jgi:hypothetical protein
MATETTVEDDAPRQDPREAGQERREGTVDLDGSGNGSITVNLSGELTDHGLGLFGTATSGSGTASLSNLTADSVDLSVSGGTASTEETWELVVTEDKTTV